MNYHVPGTIRFKKKKKCCKKWKKKGKACKKCPMSKFCS
jgi:hypothetical protein